VEIYGQELHRQIISAVYGENLWLNLHHPDERRRILVLGETGVGKDIISAMMANALAALSGYSENTKVCSVNAAAFPDELLESELFGHKKGAFSGAYANRKGLLNVVDQGGVLFLDEIGDASPRAQVKLLRALETKQYRPVGSDQTEKSDCHLISATNRPRREMVSARDGAFRNDLYYRLASVVIEIPPLRELFRPVESKRRISPTEALKRIIDHRARLLVGKEDDLATTTYLYWLDESVPEITKKIVEADYNWPGNLRELVRLIDRVIAAIDPISELDRQLAEMESRKQDGASKSDAQFPIDLEAEVDAHRRKRFEQAVRATKTGDIVDIAEMLTVSRQRASRRLKEYGLR